MQLPRASHLPRPLHATTCAPPHPTHSAARGLSALSVHNPQYRIAPHLSTTTRQRNPPAASAPSSSSESPLSAPSSRHSRRAGCTQQVGHRLTPVSLNEPALWGAALREALKARLRLGQGFIVSLRVSSETAHPLGSEHCLWPWARPPLLPGKALAV